MMMNFKKSLFLLYFFCNRHPLKKTCQCFNIDKKTAENSFQQIAKRDKLKKDKANVLLFSK